MHPPVAPPTDLPAVGAAAAPGDGSSLGLVVRRWASWIRLRHWVHFLVLPLAGLDLRAPIASSVWGLVRGIVISFLVLSFGYLLNAVTDRAMDLDADKNALVRDKATDSTFRGPLWILATGALMLAATGPVVALGCTATSLLSGALYSMGPRLKAYPIAGTLLNVTNFAPLLFVGLTASLPSRSMILLAVAFSALLLQNQLLHEAADAREDSGGDVRTTFRVAGRTASAIMAILCGLTCALATGAIATGSELPWAIVLHAAPYVVYFPALLARQGHLPGRMKAARLLHRTCSAASGALLFAMTQGWAI
jgi:4-hydroxybenzoate polyprenyltransferase